MKLYCLNSTISFLGIGGKEFPVRDGCIDSEDMTTELANRLISADPDVWALRSPKKITARSQDPVITATAAVATGNSMKEEDHAN